MVLTSEGFRDLSFEGMQYFNPTNAIWDFNAIDAEWLKMDGFDAPENWTLGLSELNTETGESLTVRNKRFDPESEVA